MNVTEFSNEFDILLDSYRRFKDFDKQESYDSYDFNEYEKSVFLTKAQEDIIVELYSGKNLFRDSFENSEELRRYLADLVDTVELEETDYGLIPLSNLSKFYELPSDVWFITYEQVKFNDESLGCLDNSTGGIVPITLDAYLKTIRNPFRRPSKNRVLRLDLSNDVVELVSKYDIGTYTMRYMTKPTPIILENLPNELTINGVGIKTECILHTALHRVILDRAVRYALNSKINNNNNKAS